MKTKIVLSLLISLWFAMYLLLFYCIGLIAASPFKVVEENGVKKWTVEYDSMTFSLPCYGSDTSLQTVGQIWTKAPNAVFQGSTDFTLHFKYLRFFDSGDYICKAADGTEHKHFLYVVSQPASGLMGSRRYFPIHRCMEDIIKFLVDAGKESICIPEVVTDGECLFKIGSVCRNIKMSLGFSYKWELFITWTLPIPKLVDLFDEMDRCSDDMACVARSRYSAYKSAVNTAKARYVIREKVEYEDNPDELGNQLTIAQDMIQYPPQTVARCPAGTFNNHNVTCEPCPPGQYQIKPEEINGIHPTHCERCDLSSVQAYGGYDCFMQPTGRPTEPTPAPEIIAVGDFISATEASGGVPGSFSEFSVKTQVIIIFSCLGAVLLPILYCVWKIKRKQREAQKLKEKLQTEQDNKKKVYNAARGIPNTPPPSPKPSMNFRRHSRHSVAQSGHSDATSRHSDAPSRHSDAPSRHSDAPSRHSDAPSRHSDAASRHSYAPSRHSDDPSRHSLLSHHSKASMDS